MRTIVVYFSLEGNVKYVADIISDYMKADSLRIEPVKNYPKGNFSKFFWCGKSAVFGETPKLAPYKFDKDEYEIIIIGTPVWAGSYAPPVKTFLRENDLSDKKIALFACNSGGAAEKCFSKLKLEMPDSDVIAALTLKEPKVKQLDENIVKIKEFCDKL